VSDIPPQQNPQEIGPQQQPSPQANQQQAGQNFAQQPYPQPSVQQPYQQYPQQAYQQAYGQQYPYSPYSMPQVNPLMYAQAQTEGLAWPFKRAGTMLLITAGLVVLCGVGCGGIAMMPQLEQAMAQAQMDPQVAAIMTPQMFRTVMMILAGASVLYAIIATILGVMVRRQSVGATIAAIVLVSIVLIYLLINMLGGFVQMGPGGQMLLGECALLVPLALFGWQLAWLIQALRSGSAIRAAQMQMQMQYWQYMQQMQQYQQGQGQQARR
jgi:hypothetical protein